MKSDRASSPEDPEALARLESPTARHFAPAHIPDHELLRRIGGGSYGEVWLARNVVGTLRAVKIVHRRTFQSERPYEREYAGIQKFEPVSRSHEGFVDILQIGRNDAAGCFYYVMELADCAADEREKGRKGAGENCPLSPSLPFSPAQYTPRTLRSDLKGHSRLPVSQCVEIGLSLARALAHLHAAGLVHRDIKPSNIIFVGGVPKLADIGLVTDAGEARSYVGTEGFIPPEGPGTPAADLFSLGKVLYEASTGKDRQDFPEPLTNLGDQPDRDRLLELNAILHRACHSDARARYRNAEEMLAELELLQRGESVKRKRAAERRMALVKRTGVAAAAILLIGLLGWLLAVSSGRRTSEPPQRHRTPAQRQEARKLYKEALACADQQTKDSYSRAVELYHQSLAIDSDFAPAYVGLAEANIAVSGWHLPPRAVVPAAKAALTKALELDPQSLSAHVWLGMIQRGYDWNWAGAEKTFQRAIQLAPTNAMGHDAYAILLAGLGRKDEARARMRLVQQLAPASHRYQFDICKQLFWERRYDEAIAHAQQALARAPNSVLLHAVLADCYCMYGRYAEAIAHIEKVRSQDDGPDCLSARGQILAAMGRTNEARQCLDELEKLTRQRHVSPYYKALVHVGLGDNDQALDRLEEAYEERAAGMALLRIEPRWDALRREPRFVALLRKLRLE